jgi:uncharacterized protein YjaZ
LEAQPAIRIVAAYHGVAAYLRAARSCQEPDLEKLWQQYVIEPYWAEWAAGQFNEARTRQEMSRRIPDLAGLEVETNQLASSEIEVLAAAAYQMITARLPSPLSERAICILPLDPANHSVLERQNGVLGTCVGDNILLQINPAGKDWQDWTGYVLAHEYHHTVWGYTYFALQQHTSMDLLTGLLTEGLADSFASMLYPHLHAAWTGALTPEQEAEQWQHIQPFLAGQDGAAYGRFMFGDEASGTPWCAGYTLGYHIVQAYLKTHPEMSAVSLIGMEPHTVLAESGYPDAQ